MLDLAKHEIGARNASEDEDDDNDRCTWSTIVIVATTIIACLQRSPRRPGLPLMAGPNTEVLLLLLLLPPLLPQVKIKGVSEPSAPWVVDLKQLSGAG